MPVIMAFDPGGTTGWAIAVGDKIIGSGEIKGEAHHRQLWELMTYYKPDIVVCEKFINRRKDAVELISRDYSGVIELYTQMNRRCAPIWYQRPDEALVLWDDDKVKKLGLWQTSKPHACDAIRHLLNYIVVVRRVTDYLYDLRT